MPPRRTKFYLDKRNARFLGVCSGLADYTGIDAVWVRVATVAITILGSGWPLLIYLITGWVAEVKPRELYEIDEEEARFWQGVRAKPGTSVRDVRSRFRDIDRRIADIEAHVTSTNTRLAREIDKLR